MRNQSHEGVFILWLVVNISDCAHIVFRVCLSIERFMKIEHMGIILSEDMSVGDDIDRISDAFRRPFQYLLFEVQLLRQ